MTAPATPTVASSYKAPADGGRPMNPEALITDDFMADVVAGGEAYEKGEYRPDANDPNDAGPPLAEPRAEPVKTTEAAKVEAKGEKVEEPKAGDEPKEPAEPLKLATEFTLFDSDGDELDIADVMGKIKEIGIPYKGEVRKLPLDRVVRLAQSGFANEKLYGEAKHAIDNYQTLETDFTAANDSITRQNAFIERLLTDETSFQQAREKFAQFNSPESRAERAERRAKELETRIAEGTPGNPPKTDTATSFFQNDVKPVLSEILTKFQGAIPEDEIIGRFNRLTAKFGQVIQPKDFPAVKEIVDDLAAWAAGEYENRATSQTAIRKAKEENTLLKKRVATGARPTGRVATATDGQAKAKPKGQPTSDANLDALVEEAMAGMDT